MLYAEHPEVFYRRASKENLVMMFSLVIISHDIAWTIDDVKDGLTHRYYGLYASLAKYVLRHGGSVFWYSVVKRRLFSLRHNPSSNTCSMLTAIIKAIRGVLAQGKPIIVLIDYPHSFLGIKHLLDYVLTLALLHVFRLLTRRIFVVVDNMDPPIEHAIELNERISIPQKILWLFLNNIVFRFDLIVFHSQSYRVYHRLFYGLSYEKSIVIPPGSFPEIIPYVDPPDEKVVTIAASGHITKWLGIEKLKEVHNNLLQKGVNIRFVLLDKSASQNNITEGVKIIKSYVDYREFINMLTRSHILLLLLRPRSLHHLLTVRASLADYLMVGRPVIYLHSLGMREIVGGIKGCFELKSFDELSTLITKIVKNDAHLKDMARSIRLYAERNLSYRKRALELLRSILLLIKARYADRFEKR